MKNYGFDFNDPNLKIALKQAKEIKENSPTYKVQQNMSKMLKDLNIDNSQLAQMQEVANSFNQYRINNLSIDNLINNSYEIKKQLDSIKSMDTHILKSVNELQKLIGKPGEPLTNEQSSSVRKVYDIFSDLDDSPFDADSFEGNKESYNPKADYDNVVSNTDNGFSSSRKITNIEGGDKTRRGFVLTFLVCSKMVMKHRSKVLLTLDAVSKNGSFISFIYAICS